MFVNLGQCCSLDVVADRGGAPLSSVSKIVRPSANKAVADGAMDLVRCADSLGLSSVECEIQT